MKKKFGLLLTVAACCTLSAAVFTACDPTPQENNDGNVYYQVSAKSVGGMPLANVTLGAYLNGNQVSSAVTDADGNAAFRLPAALYEVRANQVPLGYTVREDSVATTDLTGENKPSVILESSVIQNATVPDDLIYKVGDVVYDFTLTDIANNAHTVSEILKEKRAVVLNFWGTECTWCVREMPAMQAAYAKYSDKLELLGVNAYMGCIDTDAEIANFMSENELTFPAMSDRSTGLANHFAITGFPFTVIIDRYGVIAETNAGAVLQESLWTEAFEKYTSDDYSQPSNGGNNPSGPDENLPDKPDVPETDPALLADALISGGKDAMSGFRHDDNEYNWTWLVGEEDGAKYIHPSNTGHLNSFAIYYADVTLKAGEGIAVDFKISSEESADFLYIFVDNAIIYSVSGSDGDESLWHTVYPYIAKTAGTYELAFAYVKDEDESFATETTKDTVFLKNLHIVSAEEIADFEKNEISVDIYRNAAEGLNSATGRYDRYITPVFNEEDGYYHVNSATGPLLLANLMNSTNWMTNSVYQLAAGGYGGYYADDLITFCSYAVNSAISGYCTVDWKLGALLKWMCSNISNYLGTQTYNEEWLEICVYYDHYGAGVGVDSAETDPIRGLNTAAAISAKENEDNHVTVSRIMMPRGIYYKFVPETSGAYIVYPRDLRDPSVIPAGDELAVLFSLHDSEGNLIKEGGNYELYPDYDEMLACYLEAGQTYYIVTTFFSAEALGEYAFRIEKLDEPYFWQEAASYVYSYDLETGHVIQPSIEYGFDEETGTYRAKRGDGFGSYIFISFDKITNMGNASLRTIFTTMMEQDYDHDGKTDNFRIRRFKRDKNGDYVTIDAVDEQGRPAYSDFSGNQYYEVDGVFYRRGDDIALTEAEVEELGLTRMTDVAYQTNADGSYVYDDYTETVLKYLELSKGTGFVIADEEIVKVIAQLIDVDDYAFVGLENAWLRTAFYYDYLADPDEEPEVWRDVPPNSVQTKG